MKIYKMSSEIKKMYENLDPEMKESIDALIKEMQNEKDKTNNPKTKEVKHFADGFHEGNWQDDL